MSKAKAAKRKFISQLKKFQDDIEKKEALFSRQITEDEFRLYYERNIVEPPYPFDFLYSLHEESDILQTCVDTNICNIISFGYDLHLGALDKDREKKEYVKENEIITGFFDYPNESEHWLDVTEKEWQDYEVLGISALEGIRNKSRDLELIYHHPAKNLRLVRTTNDDRHVMSVPLPRRGKIRPVSVEVQFRRFATVNQDNRRTLRYYKSFGDPRPLCAITGEYKDTPKQCKLEASEILFRKRSFGNLAYGLPRWIGAAFEVAGRRNAEFLNYDLGENQGIPNLVLSIIGGNLSEEGYDQLLNLFRGQRGVTNFNRMMILDIEPILGQLGKPATDAKIEWKELGESRKDDIMFKDYLPSTKDNIRMTFRHPPLFTGDAGAYTYAVAYASRLVGEEQVFLPERTRNDRRINRKILKGELGAKYHTYKSRGTAVVGSEEIRKSLQVFSDIGALTINHAIRLANKALGENMSLLQEPWADLPIMVVKQKLAQQEISIPEIDGKKAVSIAAGDMKLRRILRSEALSNEEKKHYLALKKIEKLAVGFGKAA